MSNLRPFALQTPRLLVRRFYLGEVDEYVAYRNDPHTLQHYPWLSPLTRGDAWSFFTRQVAATPGIPNTQVHVAICNQQTSQVMGDCFLKVDASGVVGEVGIMLSRRWQGKGFEEEALRVLAYWACVAPDGPRLQRLTAMVDAGHTTLAAALRAAGFVKLSQGSMSGRFSYCVMQYSR